MTVVTPLRFVSGVIGVWISARVLILLPFVASGVADPADPPFETRAGFATITGGRLLGMAPVGPAPTFEAGPSSPLPQQAGFVTIAARRPAWPIPPTAMTKTAAQAATPPMPMDAPTPMPAPEGPPALSPTGIVALPVAVADAARPSRWSGSLYVYRRGDGTDALASGGQLGGSQAGARIAWRLNRDGPSRFAAAARVSTPLDDRRGAEGAVGLDWHPLPGQPLRVSVERRVDLGGAGRDAWSAYAAGGFYREPRPGLVVDGYAQAGVVGARRRDLFADGALRGGARRPIGPNRSLTLGGGVWGAAQPRVARLDIGPRAALGLPIAGTAATLAAEWRIRVAGDASPRAGLALTLASDF